VPSFLPPNLRRVILATVALSAICVSAAAASVVIPSSHAPMAARGHGVIGQLKHLVTIGSTIDPVNGDENPYGLAIAPVTSGNITAGDLITCNFNDAFNIQGLGTTIEILHPAPGSSPQRLIQDARLTGCDALAVGTSDDFPWVAALDANDNPIVSDTGVLVDDLQGHGLAQPWGQIFSGTGGTYGAAAFYETNAFDGSITRINILKSGRFSYNKIATGFATNHGVPGTILAPSGLTYDQTNDILYMVDSDVNRVVAFSHPGNIPAGGVINTPSGFSGPSAGSAKVLFKGAPLRAPISAALLFNGDIVVGNTTNNRLIEISPAGKMVGDVNLDKGAPGALFGIAASGTSVPTTKIYFNDDNANAVVVLQQ
jgi:hypothetical protein